MFFHEKRTPGTQNWVAQSPGYFLIGSSKDTDGHPEWTKVEEIVPLRPSETFTFQLTADERFLTTPSVMDHFERGSRGEGDWQRNFARHKVVIRSKPVQFKLPKSTNAIHFQRTLR